MISPAHRRSLNRALHELRRPLQALVLLEDRAGAPAARSNATRRGLLELATDALDELDGALNGEGRPFAQRRLSLRELVFGCLSRWGDALGGAEPIRVYWDAGRAEIEGDPVRLARAIDNLIANALEHGAPPYVLTAAGIAGRLRLTFANGARGRDTGTPEDPRRGHGCEVVAEVAQAHGGRFALCHTADGCVAALELPLSEPGFVRAA